MNYASATIDATYNGKTETVDLDGITTDADMWNAIHTALADEDTDMGEMQEATTLTNPQGFAVHLFAVERGTEGKGPHLPVDNFDDIAEAWNDESDDDRREAMGEYLEDMGADDLSDFEEAYQGRYDSGAAFAESLAESVGALSDSDERGWICIDWEATWERNLRHDYHITENGHVFRNL